MTNLTVLDREMFIEAEAARLLRMPQSTLHYWLEGGMRREKSYQPILRVEPTGTRTTSWAEFVEAGFLRGYRKHRVPMTELRAFIDQLRRDYGVPFPLAQRQPFVSGRQPVLEAQEAAGLNAEFWLPTPAANSS